MERWQSFMLGFLLCAVTIALLDRAESLEANSTSSVSAAPLPDGKTVVTRSMRVTAYCPCRQCCGKYADGVTASGKPVTYNGGRFVAAPKSLPFGTVVNVPEYGRVEVIDRGGAIKGDRLDVFFPTHQEALNWGVKNLEVQIEH